MALTAAVSHAHILKTWILLVKVLFTEVRIGCFFYKGPKEVWDFEYWVTVWQNGDCHSESTKSVSNYRKKSSKCIYLVLGWGYKACCRGSCVFDIQILQPICMSVCMHECNCAVLVLSLCVYGVACRSWSSVHAVLLLLAEWLYVDVYSRCLILIVSIKISYVPQRLCGIKGCSITVMLLTVIYQWFDLGNVVWFDVIQFCWSLFVQCLGASMFKLW